MDKLCPKRIPYLAGPMSNASPTIASAHRFPIGKIRFVLIVVGLFSVAASGCSNLRLPAIDPTGSRIFAPLPTTTGLALPGHNGQSCGCFGCLLGHDCIKIGKLFDKPRFQFPTPAFTEPVAPPPCPTPPAGLGTCNEPCVPSAPCAGSCKDGPPAVLFGNECKLGASARLPKQGKRGCILLTPDKIVAPVGGEVVLLSGICGTDGYLQMNEKLEWMLAPDSVGNFIQVGDDNPGIVHKLAGSRVRPEKKDPSYAIGVTSTKKMLITRGNNDPRDDVNLEKGQTWLTISSPSEGTSHVTVLAPESECWDQRKATATIYWVDARWQFPAPQIVPKETPVELTTRVTRSGGSLPARGWKVRYEILQPELATFAGTGGSSIAEANVDDSGNATVQIVPTPGTSGTTAVNMEVIRPGGDRDNIPTMTLGSGQTFVTWSSPQLAIRAGAPPVATYGAPVTVYANLSNPGDQPTTNVTVEVNMPPGAKVIGADSFATFTEDYVRWDIGTLPPQTQLDLSMQIQPTAPVNLGFVARGDGLAADDSVRIDVFQPSLTLKVVPVEDRVEAGTPVSFDIDVTNTGDRPLQNVYITASGDRTITHESGLSTVENEKEDGPLQPGETWGARVVFTPTEGGQRCISVDALADGGQRATQQACVTVTNPVPQTPNLQVSLVGRDQQVVGQPVLAKATVRNEGQGSATNVRVTMVNDPQLQISGATVGADASQAGRNIITWNIPNIGPGQEVLLEGSYAAIQATPRARIGVTAESTEGSRANTDMTVQILEGNAPAQPAPQPSLPPAGASPTIPGGPAPLTGPPPSAPTPVPSGQQRTDRIQASLLERIDPVRVNEPIRYSLRVVNDSDERDGQVAIQFELPDGVFLERVNQTKFPELGRFTVGDDNVVRLAEIGTMNPGETIDYELTLSSNQPQTFVLDMLIRSARMRDGFRESIETTVIP